MDDGFTLIVIACVLAGVALAIVRLISRLTPHEHKLRRWAIGLAMPVGLIAFFGLFGEKDPATWVFGAGLIGAVAGLYLFFLLVTVTLVYQYVLAPPFRILARFRRKIADRNARLREQKRQRREQREYERTAPLREQARKAAEEQKRRGAEAVTGCQLLYSLHAPEIGVRFPKQAFDEWIKRMSDDQDPILVERKAEQLRRIIEHHCEQVKPTPKFSNIQELAHWFQEQKADIETLPLDERTKRAHLANLTEKYAELTTKLLENLHP